jgi:hypothetical protein
MKKKQAKKTPQNSTKYRPTAAEKKLLEVLLNPEHRLKSVTEICGIAKIDRKTYYNSFDKPEFVTYFINKSKALIRKAHAGIINSCIRQALRGDATHAKLLLTMSGDYVDRHSFPDKHGEPQQIPPVVSTDMSLMDAAARTAWLLKTALDRKKAGEPKRS